MTSERIQALRTLAATGKQGAKSAAIVELCGALQASKKRRERTTTFTLSDVMVEAERMQWPAGLAEECFDCYDAVGWVRGKNLIPIVRLPSAMRTWMRNHKKWNGAPVKGNNDPPVGWVDFVAERYKSYRGTFKHAPEYMRLDFAIWKKGHSRTA